MEEKRVLQRKEEMDGEQEVEEILKFCLGTIISAGHCCCSLPTILLDGKSAGAMAEFFSFPLVVYKLPLPRLTSPTMFPPFFGQHPSSLYLKYRHLLGVVTFKTNY